MKEIFQKLSAMSNGELRRVWNALNDYGADEFYDEENGITMDDWTLLIYSAMPSRSLLAI